MPVCTLVFICYVYIRLYLMNIHSLQSLRTKIPQNFNRYKYNHLFRLKEQTELFCKMIHHDTHSFRQHIRSLLWNHGGRFWRISFKINLIIPRVPS